MASARPPVGGVGVWKAPPGPGVFQVKIALTNIELLLFSVGELTLLYTTDRSTP